MIASTGRSLCRHRVPPASDFNPGRNRDLPDRAGRSALRDLEPVGRLVNSTNMSGNALKMSVIYRIQIPNLSMNLNSLWKRAGGKPGPGGQRPSEPMKAFPLGMVLKACPQIVDYGPGGRSPIGEISCRPQLWSAPCSALVPLPIRRPAKPWGRRMPRLQLRNFERAGHINSAGGYLRDLTRRAARGEFSLGPMIMALMRANLADGKKIGVTGVILLRMPWDIRRSQWQNPDISYDGIRR